MLVAAGQFAVTSVWEKNAEICASLMAQARKTTYRCSSCRKHCWRAMIMMQIYRLNQHSCWKANSSDVYGEKVNVT
ncbi:hypothetical protein MS6204_02134 [Escherichia coli]|nr:hypothetical protein [Escherichia coli]